MAIPLERQVQQYPFSNLAAVLCMEEHSRKNYIMLDVLLYDMHTVMLYFNMLYAFCLVLVVIATIQL